MWWVWRECGVVLTDVGGTDVVPGSCTSTLASTNPFRKAQLDLLTATMILELISTTIG